MNHSAWKNILNHLCEQEELECEFGVGRRIVDKGSIDSPSNMRIVLNIYLNTTSSMRIASSLYQGFSYLSKSIQNPEVDRWDETIPDDRGDGEVFVLEYVYLKNEDALIGWKNKGGVAVVIPWENISAIKQDLPFSY